MDRVLLFHLPLPVWRGGEAELVGACEGVSVWNLEGSGKAEVQFADT
jgi:hypothetical protein